MKTSRGIIPHIKGLPHPQKLRGKFIVSTEDEDRVAVNFIHNQNVYALQSTFIRMHINDESMNNIRSTDEDEENRLPVIREKSRVTFDLFGGRSGVNGLVIRVDTDNTRTVRYKEDIGDTAKNRW